MRKYPIYINSNEGRIDWLENQLSIYENAVLKLLPKEIKVFFQYDFDDGKNYYKKCETIEEIREWKENLFSAICGISKIFKQAYFNNERAFCPFCGSGSTSAFDEGFAMPRGLEQHLFGSGSTQKCEVFEVLHILSWGYFDEVLEKERELEKETYNKRMKTETLIKISHYNNPELLNLESRKIINYYRSDEQLKLAEKRLKQMGFKKSTKDRIRSYIFKNEEYLVYADPRRLNRIDFNAYKIPLPKNVSSKSRSSIEYSFYMMDSWKHDLEEKFIKRLRKGF